MKIIILAGGSGTRLWPISRSSFPKQFLKLKDEFSLLQKTVKRFLSRWDPADIVVVTNHEYQHLVQSQLSVLDKRLEEQIIVEPARKNTAPAIALAVKFLEEKKGMGKEEAFLVSSSDYLISPEGEFLEAVQFAESGAKQGHIVIFGVKPNKPETGYGYIKIQEGFTTQMAVVEHFVEKPSLELAQQYIASGDYLWNCGLFVFTVERFWQELAEHAADTFEFCKGSFADMVKDFSALPSRSIDYAVLEKSKNIAVIPLDLFWSDMGSWDNLYEVLDKDGNQNVKIGNILDIDTKNSLIVGGKRLISTIGLEDVVIIETEDAIFFGKKGESQRVKDLVEELKKQGMKETQDHVVTHRPWGQYVVLEEDSRHKVKRIVVDPMQRLSLQMHYHRSEHWVVVKGAAKVTIGTQEQLLHENESIYVPKSTVHRLENPGKVPLEIIEVQVGEYVGEDDIIRFEDVYGRMNLSLVKS
jgi:mannose-1-phosphate guanylyltransferase/mannose-6-phosphate isomerase